MAMLLVDLLFPSRFSKWRIEEVRTFIRQLDADVLVFKLDSFAGIEFGVDFGGMYDEFDLWKFNILIFDEKFNYLNKYNKKLDGTRFNGKFPGGSYIFTQHEDFDLRRYEHVHHIFLMNFVRFNKVCSFDLERQSVHLYPGGGVTGRRDLVDIPRNLKLISTQRFVTEWLNELQFSRHIEVLGGIFMQKGAEVRPKRMAGRVLTVCFSSMGHAREKGADLFAAIAERYSQTYPEDWVRFVAIGNFPHHSLIKPYAPMAQAELDRFYADEVDILLSLDTGVAYNGWPLGVEALLQGVVLMTTDVHEQNRHFNYGADAIFIGSNDPDGYVKKIRQLQMDRSLLQSMSVRGQGMACEIYGYEAQQGRILPFILDEPPTVELAPEEAARQLSQGDSCLVTIAIPAYKPTYFEAALLSALSQTGVPFEILVCDDCPDDGVETIVNRYRGKSVVPIRYERNLKALTELGNVTRCIELARGTYIKLLYDDDLLKIGCIARQAAVLQAHPEISLVGGRRINIDEHDKILPDSLANHYPFPGDCCLHGQHVVAFLAEHTINFIGEPAAVMFRRDDALPLLADGVFSINGEVMHWLGDVALYVKLLRKGHLAMLTEPLACFRISGEQTSQKARDNPEIAHKNYKKFKENLNFLGWATGLKDVIGIRDLTSDAQAEFTPFDLAAIWRGLVQVPAAHYTKEIAYSGWLSTLRANFGEKRYERQEKMVPLLHISVAISPAGHSDEDLLCRTNESLSGQKRLADAWQILVPGTGWQWVAGGWTLLLCAGDTLEPHALWCIERALMHVDQAAVCLAYSDHDVWAAGDGPQEPCCKPDLNLDLLWSGPYMGRAVLVRNDWAEMHLRNHAGPFDLTLAYRLVLAATAHDANAVLHLPMVLAHLTPEVEPSYVRTSQDWQQLAHVLQVHLVEQAPNAQLLEGPAPGTFHVIHPLTRTPKVSIVIPTRDQLPFLSRCIESLLDKTDYPDFEILVVDNDSQTAEAQAFLSGLEVVDPERIRVLRVPGAFNFSRMNNLAVAQARGEFILLLNNDTAALHADWLSHMMRHALRDGVGIVGARLLYPEGTVQHAGVIMGLRGPAEHPCLGFKADEPGYMFRAQVTQNFSAVTAACMLVSKAVYEEVGGLDEEVFAVSYNDVDFCLRVGRTGRRIVWTPLATLLHEGSASQKASIETLSSDKKAARFTREQAAMYERWPDVIANDPAYNPNLTLVERGYEVETNPLLCHDPLKGLVDHRVVAFAADPHGCGHYRILQPMQAMLNAGLCTGGASPELFGPNLALRSGADTLVFQRPFTDANLSLLESLLPLKNVLKVYEVDDDLSRVPMKNSHRDQIPKDIRARMMRNIGVCDRLVVSTEFLAHQFRGANGDIRVVQNRLPRALWGNAPPAREARDMAGRKPVVGWAGGVSHQGDLELIAQVVKETADQVDWVFMGMCPEPIRPYVKAFHTGVPTPDYPKRLMEITRDWDLAVAPLELNAFNEAKSNLRLLEYGWCGLPVICTDITPYQCDLPAVRVKNRFKDWRGAILDAVNDLPATRQRGQDLQARVEADWMLEGRHLEAWYRAWTDR